jgi:heat shock protein 4
MFVDMGASNTSVFIVEFLKGKLKVVSTAFDRTLGGRTFDQVLVDHFCKEFQVSHDAITTATTTFSFFIY